MKTKQVGMPYMGSKRKLANKIVDHILSENPNCQHIYDLFGGGGAISFEALQRPQIASVHYNELNTGVVALLQKIRTEGITKELYQWIGRDTFHAHKNDDNWFGGLCKIIWSFGNNQKDYLFSRQIEPYKKIYHKAIVENIDTLPEMEQFITTYVKNVYNIDKSISLVMPTAQNYNTRRLQLRSQITAYKNDCRALQQLQQLERLQQLQQLQQLEQLEELSMPQYGSFHIYNESYHTVPITTPVETTVIYLDPPYQNTGSYQLEINYDDLLTYIKTSPYKIYVSSYHFPALREVAQYGHRETLCSARSGGNVIEKLFTL
jgi:site-specific DNA-adenine methylase